MSDKKEGGRVEREKERAVERKEKELGGNN